MLINVSLRWGWGSAGTAVHWGVFTWHLAPEQVETWQGGDRGPWYCTSPCQRPSPNEQCCRAVAAATMLQLQQNMEEKKMNNITTIWSLLKVNPFCHCFVESLCFYPDDFMDLLCMRRHNGLPLLKAPHSAAPRIQYEIFVSFSCMEIKRI